MNLQTSVFKFRVAWGMLTRKPLPIRLRDEFNLWAGNGRGERMERDHRPFTERIFEQIQFRADDRILDLACGEGWASRLLADRVGPGPEIVGVDIANEMVRRASLKSAAFSNLSFQCGSAHAMPFAANSFTKAFCVESFYYFESQERVLRELKRVLRPGGELFLVFCLYQQNPGSFGFLNWVRVPVHVRSIAEYQWMLENEGWSEVKTEELVSDQASHNGPGFHDRALLLHARKPL
jgi:ubiquinone/menaquinone biosynthesis C-methylase UbiE